MIIIGITGGIASGKTTITNYIKKLGMPAHDSDTVVRNLYKNGSKEFIDYLKSIGLRNSIKRNKINKKLVRNEVLNNSIKLKKLERFVHKKVRLSRDIFIKKNNKNKKKIIVLDISLLFENKLEKICDYIFLAYCPLERRKARALKRKNINSDIFDKIIKLQMPDSVKLKKSDFIINTSTSKRNTNKQIMDALKKIKFNKKQ